MPLENPELEITLTRREAGAYWARFRLRQPGGEAAVDHEANVTFDPGDLNGAAHTPDQYGAALSRALFAHERLRLAWNGAMAAAKAPLRVRLALDVDDLTLRRVRWEALADPGTGKRLLLTDQRIWFSRYLNSPSNASIRVRTKPALRALVAVAAPANLDNLRVGGRTFTDDDRFSPAAEIAEVRRALGPMTEAVTELPHDKAGPATRDNILKHLRTGYDLFYLVAHGALAREGDTDVPKLLLVNDQGAGEEVDGREFAAEIGKLWHRPVLIVLSSCQSAGATQPFRRGGGPPPADAVDTALGAELGRAGVPAVLSMLGNVFQGTGRPFVHTFLTHLAHDGRIDRAAMEARFAVGGEPDYWAPVLSSRLEVNRLWRESDAGPGKEFEGLDGVIRELRTGKYVPIIGSGLLEPYVGSPLEIARRWAGQEQVPLVPPAGDALPQVAQYLTIVHDSKFVQDKYAGELAEELDRRRADERERIEAAHPDRPPAPFDPLPDDAAWDPATRLHERLRADARRQRGVNLAEGHTLLARLNTPLYITTNPDDLLFDALRDAGKDPSRQVCDWLDPPPGTLPGPGPKPDRQPTPAAPLVYHLFGHLSRPSSVVLTEDDYFKFLVGMAERRAEPVASFVTRKLSESRLLFLGFRIDDWDFRAFLRFFLRLEGARRQGGGQLKHMAVQLDPADDLNLPPAKVRDYLDDLFEQSPDIKVKVYWHGVHRYLEELYNRWPATP